VTRTVTSFDMLDLEIAVASIALGVARSAWDHCPSGENDRRVAEAAAVVDALLDERLDAAA
jgi:alpha-D-ribose 1-methylphosphonate 5-triphosphate synthase subunit PhnG